MAAYETIIRNGQVADGTGKKLFAADVALKGDRIAAVERAGHVARRQRDRCRGQGRGAGLHRRAHARRHRLIDHPDHGDEGEPGRHDGGVRQLRRLGRALRADRCPPLDVADHQEEGNLGKTFAEFAGKVEAARPAINGAFLIGHRPCASTPWATISTAQATAAEIQ